MGTRLITRTASAAWPHQWVNPALTGPRIAVGSMTTWSGGQTVPADVYSGVRFPSPAATFGFYQVTGAGGSFTDCLFDGDAVGGATSVIMTKSDNWTIDHCEIIGDFSWDACHNNTMTFCNSHSCGQDPLHVTGDPGFRVDDDRCLNIVIQDTWAHDPAPGPSSHTDGCQVLGTKGITIQRCLIDMGPQQTGSPLNSAIYLEAGVFQGIFRDVLIDSNYINSGGTPLQLQAVGDTGIYTVTNNQFGPDAQFGNYACYTGGLPDTQSNNLDFSGNPVTIVVNS